VPSTHKNKMWRSTPGTEAIQRDRWMRPIPRVSGASLVRRVPPVDTCAAPPKVDTIRWLASTKSSFFSKKRLKKSNCLSWSFSANKR
jgi:hypothetical protein